MLDIKFIRENYDLVKQNSKNRLSSVDIDKLLELDGQRRKIDTEIEKLRAERNAGSKVKPTPEQIQYMKKIGDDLVDLEKKYSIIINEYKKLLYQVPNITHPEVRVSNNEDDNPVLEQVGEIPQFDFIPLDHVQLAEKLDLIDFERGTKVSGTKFYFLKNEIALMELALEMYAFETISKHGYTPIMTPDMAKTEIIEGLGYSPRDESTQIYNLEKGDLSCIGTSEITMGGYHMNEIFDESDLPKKYVAFSHCFRTEAGAYSKFSKGIFRVHQFSKVEMFQYTTQENSDETHKELLEIEKQVFKGLGITFRVIDHCTADLGGPSYRTYDLEAWMPGKPNKSGGQGDWAEITSTSNCTDYQSRGLNIKYKTKNSQKEFVYMFNGTGISLCRALIVIMENHQQADGSIIIPEVLRKYMNGREKIG